MDKNLPVVNTVSFYPEGFTNKSNNEPFIQRIMAAVLPIGVWTQGNPQKQEPDYFFNGIPFAFTIASDLRKKNNFQTEDKA